MNYTTKDIIKSLHPDFNFDGVDAHIKPIDYSDIKFWLHCDKGIFGYNKEEPCKLAADYFGVDYHVYTGTFGYFKKGAWIRIWP